MFNPVWKLDDYVRLCLDVYYPVKDFQRPEDNNLAAENDLITVPIADRTQKSIGTQLPHITRQAGTMPFDELPVILTNKTRSAANLDDIDSIDVPDIAPQTKCIYYTNSLLPNNGRWIRRDVPIADTYLKVGFYAAYYEDLQNPQCGIIVFRGSDDVYDFVWHDMQLAMGNGPRQCQAAAAFYIFVRKKYNPKWLAFAGHSLGGALAQLIGNYANKQRKLWDVHSAVYPIVCFNAPQMGALMDARLSEIKSSDENWDRINTLLYRTFHFPDKDLEWYRKLFQGDFNELSADAIPIITNLHYALKTVVNQLTTNKNLEQTAVNCDAGFNVLYVMLSHAAVLQNSVNNVSTARDKFTPAIDGYSHVFNFNALFDGVHVVGKPVGRHFSIDIDRSAHNQYWQVGMAGKKPGAHSALDTAMYTKCDALTALSLNQDYINGATVFVRDRIAIRQDNRGVFKTTTVVAEHCTYQKHNINRIPLLIHLPFISRALLAATDDTLALGHIVYDCNYLFNVQHSIDNLAHVIINDKDLRQMTIDPTNHPENFKAGMDNYYKREPLPVYTSTQKLDVEKINKALAIWEDLEVDLSRTEWQVLIKCSRDTFERRSTVGTVDVVCVNNITGEKYEVALGGYLDQLMKDVKALPSLLLESRIELASFVSSAWFSMNEDELKRQLQHADTMLTD